MVSRTSAARSPPEPAQDLDLVVLGQLLENVREPLVVERGGDLGAALGAEVVDELGEVGGLEALIALEQLGGALTLGLQLQPGHLVDVDEDRLAPTPTEPGDAAGTAGSLAGEHLDDEPVPVALLLDGEVLDRRVERLVRRDDADVALEQLGDHQRLAGPLLEPAHVDQTGGDDLSGVDAGDTRHRDEDPTTPGHLDHEAYHAGGPASRAELHDDVTDAAHLVTEWVEHPQSGQACHEDARHGAHGAKAIRLSGGFRDATSVDP